MKKVLPWIGLGLLAAAVGGTTFGCSSSSDGGGTGGAGGGLITGGTGGAGGTGATGGSGATGGTGATAGTGGGTGTTQLGAKCTTDADCGTGLKCETAKSTDFGSGGPSLGYCTTSCTQNSDCTSFDSTAQCVNVGGGKTFCLQGCDPASTNACQGRYDSLCLPLSATGPDGGTVDSGAPINACIPYCGTDNDCDGLKCDLSSGLCTATPKTGDPVGTPCNPQAAQDAGTDNCAGFCIGFQGQPANVGTCTAFCSGKSVGLTGECGSNPAQGSAQNAACLFQATFNSGGSVGICGQLCNCDGDCLTSGQVCEGWAAAGVSNPSQFVQALKQAGLCVSGTDPDGGTITGISCGTGGTGGTAGTGGTGGSGGSTGGTGGVSDAGTG